MQEKMKEDRVGEERKVGRKKDEAAQQWETYWLANFKPAHVHMV